MSDINVIECGSGLKCGNPPSDDYHTCPFQEDVNKDSDYQCNCCEDCEYQCARDV